MRTNLPNRRTTWLCAALLASCGGGDGSPPMPTPAPAAVAPSGAHRVVVFATDSLRAPFTALAARYREAHPLGEVELRCAGSAELLAALLAGERADVVALGDSSAMSRVAAAALLESSSAAELARNRLALAVAPGNPLGVRSLADLVRPGVRVALGRRSASIGRHARWVLSRQHLAVEPVVETASAAAALAAVAAGDADAAIVYATSFAGGTGVARVDLGEPDNTPVLYSIAAVRTAAEPAGARAFRALALGAVGQGVLGAHGFLPVGAKGR